FLLGERDHLCRSFDQGRVKGHGPRRFFQTEREAAQRAGRLIARRREGNVRAGQERLWSGRRDSNPRPRPWQGRALPLSYTRIRRIHIMAGEGVCKHLPSPPCRRKVPAMASPPLAPHELFARLHSLGIAHKTYTHPPVFTVADAVALRGQLPGGHCKSLFLKDKKGGLWLVVALEERRIDLKRLADALGAPRFSFGNAELLYEVLGV